MPYIVFGGTAGRPIARIAESMICCPGERVALDGWASIDIGGDVDEWMWHIDAKPPLDTTIDLGELIISAPVKPRTYFVVLRVKDNEGNLSDPDTSILHVMHSPPRVSLGPDTTIKPGIRLSVSPKVESHCSRIVLYEWDLDGDGHFEHQSNLHGRTSKVYTRPGARLIKFRATDEHGFQAGGARRVRVVGVGDAPRTRASVPED